MQGLGDLGINGLGISVGAALHAAEPARARPPHSRPHDTPHLATVSVQAAVLSNMCTLPGGHHAPHRITG